METKNELRLKYKNARDEMDASLKDNLSAEICSHILGSGLYQQAKLVFVYYPLHKEVSLLPLITDALAQEKKIAFPKILENEMEFYLVENLGELEEGYFHVMEPVTGHCVVAAQDTLVLTPGVVFDMSGNRIGYGKGFYDRYLSRYPQLTTMGIAYESQVVEKFDASPRDVKMNYLVTELGIRKIDE